MKVVFAAALGCLLLSGRAALVASGGAAHASARVSLRRGISSVSLDERVLEDATVAAMRHNEEDELLLMQRIDPLYQRLYKPTCYDTMLQTPRLILDRSRKCLHGWDITNPALHFRNGSLLALFRASCIEADFGSHRRWYSKLIFGRANVSSIREELSEWEWSEFGEAGDPRFSANDTLKQECLLAHRDFSTGPEDPKMVTINGKVYVIITGLDTLPTGALPATEDERPGCLDHGFLMHAYELESPQVFGYGRGVKLVKKGMGMIEKNWDFFSHPREEGGQDLMAVYRMQPRTIVKANLLTGEVTHEHTRYSSLVGKLAKAISMDTTAFHGGAGVAKVAHKHAAGRIAWRHIRGYCLKAVENVTGSPVVIGPCTVNNSKEFWHVVTNPGVIASDANPELCLDSTGGNLSLESCHGHHPGLQFTTPSLGVFGSLADGNGSCVRADAEDGKEGTLTLVPCELGDDLQESKQRQQEFRFFGRLRRDYYLSVMHVTSLGASLPYRNWPYRFSVHPPFEILEIGGELTPYLLSSLNPSYGTPVTFVTSVLHDHVLDEGINNIVLGYGSGDSTSRIFRMPLDVFEKKFFGASNASFKPDALGGAAAAIQRRRLNMVHGHKASPNRRLRSRSSEIGGDIEFKQMLQARMASAEEAELASGLGNHEDVMGGGSRADSLFWPEAPISNRWRKSPDESDGDDGIPAGAAIRQTLSSTQPGSKVLVNDAAKDRAEVLASSEAEMNLCFEGRLIPELFILGAQASFASQFLEDLQLSRDLAVNVEGIGTDSSPVVLEAGNDDEEQISRFWRWIFRTVGVAVHGTPPSSASREQSTRDHASPPLTNYSVWSSCPSSTRMVATHCSHGFSHGVTELRLMSHLIRGTPLQTRMKFVVLLRDPVRRLQAAHADYHQRGECAGDLPSKFYDVAQNMLSFGAVCKCSCNEMLPRIGDGRALHDYFALFDSTQFTVAPFAHVVDAAFPRFVWGFVGVSPGFANTSTELRYEQLDPLSTVLEDGVSAQLYKYFEDLDGSFTLPDVLVNVNAELYGYFGRADDKKAIAQWLSVGFRE